MEKDILGIKVKVGEKLVVPNNKVVSAYLAAARRGKGLADLYIAQHTRSRDVSEK